MAQILGKKIARIFSVFAAALFIFGAAFLFTACETNHPKIKMTIEFNDETYELSYKLYRNMYPNTVAHYIELIDMKFFDNTVIHDYSSSATNGKGQGFYGGYYYMAQDDDEKMTALEYEEKIAEKYGDTTLKNISVWADEGKQNPLNYLCGEFADNGFKVENNGLTHRKGSISTAYYMENSATDLVYTKLAGGAGKHYKYNSTTSGFFVSSTSNSSLDSSYCTFGILSGSKSETRFDELLKAIDDYIDEQTELDEDYSFTEEQEYTVEGNDYVGDTTLVFNVPKSEGRITIKKVVVTQY